MDGGHKLAGGITMFFVFSNSSTLLVPGMRAPISGGYNHQSDCCDYSFNNDIVTLLNVFVLLQSCLDFWWVIWCLFFLYSALRFFFGISPHCQHQVDVVPQTTSNTPKQAAAIQNPKVSKLS